MDAREKSIAAQGLLITGACPFIFAARVSPRSPFSSPLRSFSLSVKKSRFCSFSMHHVSSKFAKWFARDK